MQKIQGKGDLDDPSNGVSRNDRRENKHGLDAAQRAKQARDCQRAMLLHCAFVARSRGEKTFSSTLIFSLRKGCIISIVCTNQLPVH